MISVAALVLLASQAADFPCNQVARPFWDGLPITVNCLLEEGLHEYTIRAAPNRKEGVLTDISLIVHGVVKSVKTPPGWKVQQQPGSDVGSIEVTWERVSDELPSKPEGSPIVFSVAVSGEVAWYYCPSSYGYRHKNGRISGGASGCPIG